MRPTDALAYRRMTLDIARSIVANQRPDDEDPAVRVWDDARDLVEIVSDCETYYVTADMTAVASAASRTMPRQELRRDDLPSERGFMLFDQAIGTAKFADADVPVTAAAWGPQGIRDFGQANPGYECTCDLPDCPGCVAWSDGEAAGVDSKELRRRLDAVGGCTCPGCTCPAGEPLGEGEEFAIFPMGLLPGTTRLIPLDVYGDDPHGAPMSWICGDVPCNDYCEISAPLLATWTLMQQSLSVSERQPADRPERRRASRAQLPSDVLVVRLRRRSIDHDGPEDAEEAGVSWSHRWLVGGHWRNQWLPSRAAHRVQWIAGYVKGPASKPLVVKDRVTAWVR